VVTWLRHKTQTTPIRKGLGWLSQRMENWYINPLKIKCGLMYLKPQSVLHCKHFLSHTKHRLLYSKTQYIPRSKHFSSHTKHRPLYLKTQYRAVNSFHLGYKNQTFYDVSDTSHCLLSSKYKTHKYSAGRAYKSRILNCWCIK
jgi:hypothetical protein